MQWLYGGIVIAAAVSALILYFWGVWWLIERATSCGPCSPATTATFSLTSGEIERFQRELADAAAALYALGVALRELERQGWVAPPTAPDASHAENPPGA